MYSNPERAIPMRTREDMPKRTLTGELNLHIYSTTSTWHCFSYSHP